jgi:hypothetical protein
MTFRAETGIPRRTVPRWALRPLVLLCAVGSLILGCSHSNQSDRTQNYRALGSWTNVHIRLTFVQSPVEGWVGHNRDGAITNAIDLAVQLQANWTGRGDYRGSLRIFRHLPNDTKVVLFGECRYDPVAHALEIDPCFGYLRCPDAVYSNMSPLGGDPRPAMLIYLQGGPYRLSGIREADPMNAPGALTAVNDSLGTARTLQPATGSTEPRYWHFRIAMSSLGLLPRDVDGTWRGIPIGDSREGIGYLMIDSRLPNITAPRPRKEPEGSGGKGN